ncbi:16378_t:CDS:1, partial [Dentiscutata heterogama]
CTNHYPQNSTNHKNNLKITDFTITQLEFLDNKENNNTKSQIKSDRKTKLIQAPIDKTKDNISSNILENTDTKLLPIEISPIQSEESTNQR